MKNLRIKIIIFTLFFFINLNSNSIANVSSNFINDITTRASNILSSQDTEEFKIQELIKIGENSVDIDGIGFYTLGKHRKNLNDVQKDEFKKIFRKYFLKSFSTRLVEYKEAKIVVISEDVKNDKYTIVKSKLLATSNRPEVAIDWRVYTKDPSKPLIRDLIIEGLSLARTQREEFNSIIMNNDGNISALFISLKEFNK
ncbi:MlaC/ttg2D family ABC transporter substrate-binding protein [Candidatus Pelagibacter communis]|uniref:MlaC/ttg2D family ABC transporter substrate-binding protein n=1 Tax=Pelagibacter ubique TaxID=198252 RepID=UPI00094D7C8A|nr:ABC transporter substrate-binding protein [Candidatus Pelagibacter ubique]